MMFIDEDCSLIFFDILSYYLRRDNKYVDATDF